MLKLGPNRQEPTLLRFVRKQKCYDPKDLWTGE